MSTLQVTHRTAGRLPLPPPALLGYLLLLAVLFTAAWAAGHAAGPVAPDTHRAPSVTHGRGGPHGMTGMGGTG
jgi:hypothetical protein